MCLCNTFAIFRRDGTTKFHLFLYVIVKHDRITIFYVTKFEMYTRLCNTKSYILNLKKKRVG